MSNENLLEIIEKLNSEKCEIKNSSEYKIGKTILDFIKFIKKRNFKGIYIMLSNKRAKKKLKKISKQNEFIQNPENKINYKECKIAIYTCIIGNYDNVNLPLLKFPNVDYYLFTDEVEKFKNLNDIFIIKKIEKKILNKGNILANRYIKFHPNEILKEYDYSIYIDGNVRIVSDIRKFINKINKKTGLAMHLHRERNCIYDEVKACILFKRGNKKSLINQAEKYKSEGFPKEYGMNEATVIVSDISNKMAISLLKKWYEEFEKSESLRDQIAWPYVLWKNNLKISDVGILGNDIYKNYVIEIVQHR